MNEKRFSIYYIFLFCFFLGFMFFVKINSFAISNTTRININVVGNLHAVNEGEDDIMSYRSSNDTFNIGTRFCLVYDETLNPYSDTPYYLMSNISQNLSYDIYRNSLSYSNAILTPRSYSSGAYIYRSGNSSYCFLISEVTQTSLNIFYNYEDAVSYVTSGELPSVSYDEDLNLDSFHVWSYKLLLSESLGRYDTKFQVTWSNPNISFVKVRVSGTDLTQDYVGSTSSLSNTLYAADFAHLNGDVITFTATPYKSDGSYGTSLYYSLTFDGNGLITNILRRIINTPHQDNTIEIPYNGVDKDYPVEGITTNNNYKVIYNPITNEYYNFSLYEIIYSPIIVYPEDTPQAEITDTQVIINNYYNTDNYYETTKDIKYDFNLNINDVTTNDITDTYHDVGNFFDGFGGVVGKIASLFSALFPFLSPSVSVFIVVGFGLLIFLAIIALIIKIVDVLADIIPF